ncbi:prepilin peptidase [Sphingomonas lutea]|uniref:Prepilin peptidase n=1 Tax=Sphingomonas lutea TaxID=1045317 RepID=A0A7G9SJ83_9SPHN|nr:prepilin peptidase [Sphingomonas lutea]QNN67908.1 prepilin peptidase [Sphingomonas lutea]
MNLFASAPDYLLWLLGALLVAAAIQDAVQLKISNYISGAALLAGVAAAVLSGLELAVWQNLAVLVLTLTIGTMMFSRGILGGGDVKLLAAVALWTDLFGAVRLVTSIFIFGGILALIIILGRAVAPQKLSERVAVLRPKMGIPYGIAIAVGTLFIVIAAQQDARPKTYVPTGVTIQQSG